ncbi:MAG: LamG-like jellyroll fold domain-containing protein [Solirubrobacterales bacterium]
MITLSKDQGYALRSRARHRPPQLLFIALVTAFLVATHSSAAAQANPVPVAAYSFDEGSGTIAKDSAGNHDGTISGATWAPVGKYGAALDFDGVNDLVTIADSADLDLTSSFTLEAWVRPDTITAARPVIAKSESAGGSAGYVLSARYAGNPTGLVANLSTAKSVARPSPLPEDVWSHLAFTSDGANLRLYVNGELAATASAIAAKATAANLVIGYGQILGGYFDGMIDEVRIYADTLSESEIQVDRDTAVGLDQIPVAAYSFDEGAGTTLGDSIDNHDGTISGATWSSSGKYGGALSFDGVNDVVSIADASDLDLTSTFTLEAWVRPDTATDWSPVIAKNENPESGYGSGYVLFSQGPGKPRGWLSNAGATKAVTGPSALPTNEWSHLAFTSDGTNLRLYLNGTLVGGPASASTAGTTASALEIGHWAYLNKWFDGLIDEVRIYDETLSETQIQTDRDNRIQPPSPSEVTTSVLDTGPSSEKVSSVPITASGTETAVYSLAVPSLKANEVLRATGNLEMTNTHTYDVTDSVRLVLGSSATDATGTVVTPWTSFQHTKDILHWTFPINGLYHSPSNSGTQYLKAVVKASSASAKAGDTLTVQPNFGRLGVTRYTPAVGPMSQPTHQLQVLTDQMKERATSIPVDEGWRLVLSRKVNDLSVNDILDLTSQLEVQNPNGVPVQVESRLTTSMAPSVGGDTASPTITDRLIPGVTFDRIVHSNQFPTSDPAWRYINLVIRAKPLSGSPSPLTVTAGSAVLNVMRLKPNPGDPTASLRQGTLQQVGWDIDPNVESIPFCPGGCQKRVVASAPVYDGMWKDEVLRVRGLVTGSLPNGAVAQVLTRLVLADSPTATTGETVGVFSGDKAPGSMQVHTSVKEGIYVVPKAELGLKHLNFVVYVSHADTTKSMQVEGASLSFTRSKPTFGLNATYEDGSLDQFFRFDNDGVASVTSALAREGEKSMEVNLDFSNDKGEDPEERRRVEVNPPDKRTSGGYFGEDAWYGFSAYFPQDFKVPQPDSPEATAGTWNVFAQWHHEAANDGLDCASGDGGGVPIAFGARWRKKESFKNPGSSSWATPVDGDYLEVWFYGGQVKEDCSDTIKATERFVIGLVERGRWYDFVLHTHWTHLEGSPEDSVSEVWMDGKKVLGTPTLPVLTPPLVWHGSPMVHNNSAYLKFGMYRGPSIEEPKTRLYIDSFMRGNSYSEVAPG